MTSAMLAQVFEQLRSEGEVQTQTEFGEKLGWGRAFTSQVVSGTRVPPKGIKSKLSEVFPKLDLSLFVSQQNEANNRRRKGSALVLSRPVSKRGEWYTNKYGVRFEALADGTWLAHHKKVPHAAHAAAAAGWGDAEYTESLPESTTIVAEPSEDNIVTFEVVGDCQDDNTKEAISEGDEVTGRSYPRDMWRYKLPFDAPGKEEPKKKIKVRNGKGEETELGEKKRYRNWVFIDRQHGIHIAIIKDQDVEKGILYCTCRNPDKKKYPDFEIHMDDCVQILYVVDLKRNF